MIKEAIDVIRRGAAERLVQVLPHPDPRLFILHQPGEPVMQLDLPEPIRAHRCESLGGLLKLARFHYDDHAPTRMAVFYSFERVELVIDTSDARERAVMELQPSVEYETLEATLADDRDKFTADGMRKVLRRELWLAIKKDKDLIKQVGLLKTSATTTVGQDVRREGSSYDAAETARTVSELPNEDQVLMVRPWANHELDHRFAVDCYLDPDTRNNQWEFGPLRHSWQEMRSQALVSLGNLIHEGLGNDVSHATSETPRPRVMVYEGTFRAKFPEVAPAVFSADRVNDGSTRAKKTDDLD